MKGQREDELNHDIDRDLSRLFSQAFVVIAERPGWLGGEVSVEEAREHLLDRLRNVEVHWGYLQSIYGSPGTGN